MVDQNAKSRWFVVEKSDIFQEGACVETSRPVTVEEMKEIFCDAATVFEPISEQEYKDMSEG